MHTFMRGTDNLLVFSGFVSEIIDRFSKQGDVTKVTVLVL